jgi:hypothetical protein
VRLAFRHGDRRYPFLWETATQPAGRWHGVGDGPAQYLADTPDGAWAEFLRHEGITDPTDLAGVTRRIWAVELPADIDSATPVTLRAGVAEGGLDTYPACRRHAARLRAAGATALRARSAALLHGTAAGQRVRGALVEATPAGDGVVWVLFGPQPALRGWAVVDEGAPTERVLRSVRPL